MNKSKRKVYTIDEYINIGKSDIFLYLIMTVALFFLLLLYAVYSNCSYYILLFDLIMLYSVYERIVTYNTLKQIKSYLIENNLLDKIGKIDYWNEKYYFLTDNYMIVKNNGLIYSFKYSEIERIFKEDKIHLGKHSSREEYLHIITNNNKFRILTYSSFFVGEDYEDITDYLIVKNPKIKIDETVNNNNIDIFKIEKR